MENTITVKVPNGKRAEWVNGVLSLVDDCPITERIKTFTDALEKLGEDDPLVKEYWAVVNLSLDVTQDLISYLKLRIIIEALNEGWKPMFDKNEDYYYIWFYIYTKEEYDRLDEGLKKRCVLRSGYNAGADCGIVYAYAVFVSSFSYANFGSRLAFKSRELAQYAYTQFFDEFLNFILPIKNNSK